jgi:hypothetical protein
MVDPTRPDLREPRRPVAPGLGARTWKLNSARSAEAPPPASSTTDGPAGGDPPPPQTLRYVDLLHAIEAIGVTVDRLNSQLRSLLTQVGHAIAEDPPKRTPG